MINSPRQRSRAILVVASIAALAVFVIARTNAANSPSPYPLKLRSGDRYLSAVESEAFLKSSTSVRGGIIQFESIPSTADREALVALGVVFGKYLPENAFIASIPANVNPARLESHGVKWAGALSIDDKLTEVLAVNGVTPEFSLDDNGIPRFSFGLLPHIDLKDAESWMASEYGATIIGTSKLTHSIAVGLPTDNWREIAADERITLVEVFWPRVALNNSSRANVKADIVQAAPYGLTGGGIVVGEWDEGRASTTHPDFAGRLISGDASTVSWHGTHVAGTILGSGSASGGTYKGMAPEATLLTQQWWFSSSEMESEYSNAIINQDLRISTNSWGLGVGFASVPNCNALMGNYFSECAALDDAVRGGVGAPLTITWAAGNERSGGSSYCGSVGFTFGTIIPYGAAKNIITVGGLNSNNSTMYSASSWGPTDDGRVKPELMAPGCQTSVDFGVTSTTPGGGYGSACGTSMATPTVAGCVALFMQRWPFAQPGLPQPASVKAAFVESADNLNDPGPEYDWGYGRVNVQAAIDLINQDRILEDSIAHGETKSWTFVNNGSIPTVSVTMAWDDPAAAPNASVALINNLNLRLIPPTGPSEYLPWALNPASPGDAATTGVNTRDNLEQVRRTSGIEVGTWTVEVTGASVPEGPQRFSLAYAPGITLTSTNQAYAVGIQATSNPSSTYGIASLPFELSNSGMNNDTYDVTLTSSHGWSIASNPRSIALNAGADSVLLFDLTIPPGTPYGTVDTVIALAESQAAPPLNTNGVMYVTVVSGRAVSISSANDTAGVAGRTINMTARLRNLGVFDDTLDWAVFNDGFWITAPASGSEPVGVGDSVDVVIAVTIPGVATPGLLNDIYVDVNSEDDPTAFAVDQTTFTVIANPPVPVLTLPADDLSTNDNTPTLRWTHGAYPPPPPGFSDFSYYLDIEEDPVPITPTRYGPIADTFFVLPALPDGGYEWRVTTVNPVGDSSMPSAPRQFNVDTEAPLAPVLDQPGDDLYEADTTLTFTWQSAVGADLYKWEIANDLAFTTGVDSVWTANLSNDRILEPCSTVVYWRVSSKDDAGNISAPSAANSYAVYMVGDMNFDCILDIIDVVQMVAVAFRGEAPPIPAGRAELLCAPPTDITDVVRLIEVVFRGGSPPCGPS